MRFAPVNARDNKRAGSCRIRPRALRVVAVLGSAGLLAVGAMLPGETRAAELCVGDCNADDQVMIDELILGVNIALGVQSGEVCPPFGEAAISDLVKGVNNALYGCGGGPPTLTPTPTATPTRSAEDDLGERIFSIDPVSTPGKDTRSQFKSTAGSLLGPTPNISAGFSAGPLKLLAGKVGTDGKAPLRLAEDAVFGVRAYNGTLVCFKLLAEGSEGYVGCTEAPRPDVTLTEQSGKDVPEGDVQVSDGPTADGRVLLQVTRLTARLPMGSAFDACSTATWEPEQVRTYYTTGQATATKGQRTMTQVGESVSCDNWTTENGPGMLVAPVVEYTETPLLIGDTANTMRLADAPDAP
jgi:hypothetical protein